MSHDAPQISAPSLAPARADQPAPVYVGHSAASRQVQALILRAVRIGRAVLVSGPPGTGKRTVAEILHHFSDSEVPALEQTSIDELRLAQIARLPKYGYVCPIEALSIDEQAGLALLASFRPIVLGTRLDPASDEGRERLHPALLDFCFHIPLPSLRDRIEDLDPLAWRILWTTPSPRPIAGISDFTLECLRAHPWPGNVTELEDVLLAAIASCTGEQIEPRDLPPGLRLHAVDADDSTPDLDFSLLHAERAAVERAMRYVRCNKRKAARLLGIGKSTLYRKLRSFDEADELAFDEDDD